jgi:hypothetical protein
MSINDKFCTNNIQSNSVITSRKGLNILCRYKRALFEHSNIMLGLSARN